MESSKKKCQGWKLARGSGWGRSVEVAEFVIESAFEFGRGLRRNVALATVGATPRPAERKRLCPTSL